MGSPKALLEYHGETFADRLIRVLSLQCDPVIVVTGRDSEAIRAGVRGNARFVVNPDPDRGQLSSLQMALSELPAEAEGFLFIPVDCPTVEDSTVATLLAKLPGAKIVIPRYEGRRGHPVCVAREVVREFLEQASTDETRAVIQRHADEIAYVDVDDPGVLADIDDREAYRRLAQ
jgi:molybdenum cofactor cytidylyltransferase